MTVAWLGDRAVVVDLDSRGERAQVVGLLTRSLPGCDVRAGMDAVLVEGPEPDLGLLAAVRAALTGVQPGGPAVAREQVAGPVEVTIEVAYDGTDLAEVADRLRCSAADVVDGHAEQRWQVAFVGFAPGFGYLEPVGPSVLDWSAVSRRASPRARVPAGAVALAAGCSAVYPRAMPGGWMLIGTSTTVLFDPSDPSDPSLLHAGDRVRFVVVPGHQP